MKDKLLNSLDTILIFNTFFVLFSFLWLMVALVGRSTGIPLGLDLWYQLWEPLFTPAIGLLMGGALLSGLSRQILKRLSSSQ